jgi:GDPmannose 4,6-dehydratase
MWMMLQHETPDDYVVATGESHSVREFVEHTAKLLGYQIEWHGKGLKEKGVDLKSGKVLVEIDPRYFRPAEVDFLLGDASKARNTLGWKPSVTFEELVKLMVEGEFEEMGLVSRDYLV